VWGTDYPHVNIVGDAPDDGLLVDLLARIAPHPEHLRRLLVDNPAELFDFPDAGDVGDVRDPGEER
jgi:predicted TIM-barrel fold metal-dependent hydrolase